jgi:hypothetical protein
MQPLRGCSDANHRHCSRALIICTVAGSHMCGTYPVHICSAPPCVVHTYPSPSHSSTLQRTYAIQAFVRTRHAAPYTSRHIARVTPLTHVTPHGTCHAASQASRCIICTRHAASHASGRIACTTPLTQATPHITCHATSQASQVSHTPCRITRAMPHHTRHTTCFAHTCTPPRKCSHA